MPAWRCSSRRRIPTPASTCSSCRATAARWCMEALVARALSLGARRALPGEFTQRAFLNDKLDLAQAEAIADLIDAGSREAARAAMRSLQGEFSAMVRGLTEAVIELRTYVEAAIDFPEEEIDFLADRELGERFQAVRDHFEGVLEQRAPGTPAARGHDRRASPGARTPASRVCSTGSPATTRRSSRRSPAPRATSCASASRSTACRCTCSTPPGCARRSATWSRRRASGARRRRWRAPTGCCSSSMPWPIRARPPSARSRRACRRTCP